MVHVACIQVNSGNNLQGNLDKIKRYLVEAKQKGAEFITLPENAAFMAASHQELLAQACDDGQHPLLDLVSEFCKKEGVWVLIGSLATKLSDTEKLANRSYLYNDKGECTTCYDKIHLYDVEVKSGESHQESRRYIAGDTPVLAEMPWGKAGLTICYDLRFPQLYRYLAQQGASILTVPAAFTYVTGQVHWEVLLRARAIETGSYVVAPAQVGEHPANRRTYGHSLIIGPWGDILADGGEEEGVVVADVDVSRCHDIRNQIPSLMQE